ncbi:MAG TPA: hypothetical protein PKE66_08685, partial [Pyrinomonadaceae bacterium]|nr:hypothetical protein [Pyrinomonadaceae bacterium]
NVNVTSIHAFAERVSLITDGNDPVGRAAALQLALQGSYVIVGDPDGSSSGGLDDLLELGTLAAAVNADAVSDAGVAALSAGVNSKFERLDLLVNIFRSGGQGIAAAEAMIDSVAELMTPRPKPRIVNVFRPAGQGDIEAVEAATVRLRSELPGHFQVNSIAVADDSSAADDIARVVLFLLSGESKAIRGETIKIR